MVPKILRAGLFAALVFSIFHAVAVDVTELKKEVERIREEIKHQDDPALTAVSKLDNDVLEKYGPNDAVKTRVGRLSVNGLVQVWYQTIQNDSRGIIVPVTNGNNALTGPRINGVIVPQPEPNALFDNDTFRIRRTELRFSLDITDNVAAFIMMDPSREANTTFTPYPTNPNHNGKFNNPHLADGSGRQLGTGINPQLMQDAFIAFSDIVPHHDFRFGQFKPPAGEESSRDSSQLDFVDRSMVTAINNVRDIGVQVHGSWIDKTTKKGEAPIQLLQYWFGAFNGPNGTVLTDPELAEGGNRSADHNCKDFCWRISGRPLWEDEKWYGRLEVGIARTDGFRGKSGNSFDPNGFINSIDRTQTAINRQSAWLWYRPNGPVKGWWIRGEYGSGHDRYNETSSFGADGTSLLGLGAAGNGGQIAPAPVTAYGYYAATGYRLSNSIWASDLDKMCPKLLGKALKNSEFTYRYEKYQNVASESLSRPSVNTDLFMTTVNTIGYNYYIDGYRTRLQANYLFVDQPSEPTRGLRGPRSDMFVINFQVSY